MPVSFCLSERVSILTSQSLFVCALVLAGGLLVGCAGPSRLAVDPSQGSLDAEATPGRRAASQDSLVQSCSGVMLGKGVFEMQCRDHHRFYVARYDASPSPERCRTVLQRVYDGVTLTEGPSLDLADSTRTYRLAGMGDGGIGPDRSPGLAACGSHRKGGLGLLLAQEGLVFDSLFATQMLTTLAHEGLPGARVLSRTPSEVPFVGRTLPVHSSCELKGAQNLSCFPNGQMNWGAFSTLARAREAQSLQIEGSRRSVEAVLADTTVGCAFEAVETQCRRLVYRAPVSRIATGAPVMCSSCSTLRRGCGAVRPGRCAAFIAIRPGPMG